MKVYFKHFRIPDYKLVKDRGAPTNNELFPYSRSRRKAFNPAPRGGATECLIALDGVGEFKGLALCSRGDAFCYRTGRDLAFERAIGECLAAMENSPPGVEINKNEYLMKIPKEAAPYVAAGFKSLMSDKHYSAEYRKKLGEVLSDVKVIKVRDDA